MAESPDILCRTTSWYSRRRWLMIAMFLGFAVFFFYDWQVGYPKKAADYAERWPQYRALVFNPDGTKRENGESEWIDLALKNGWDKEIKETDWNYKIKEQMWSGIITGSLGLLILGFYLRNRVRTLAADAESFTVPDGRRIPFSAVYRVDKRKWDHKGLAYVGYKDEAGTERKAVIDDLIYGGAVKVLDRLLANFRGELIELESPESSASGSASSAAPDGKSADEKPSES